MAFFKKTETKKSEANLVRELSASEISKLGGGAPGSVTTNGPFKCIEGLQGNLVCVRVK